MYSHTYEKGKLLFLGKSFHLCTIVQYTVVFNGSEEDPPRSSWQKKIKE